jgi:membrane protein YdbS with pleckstrin-like domain
MIKIEPNEHIIMELRKHWYVLLVETSFLIILVIGPLVILTLAGLWIKINISLKTFLFGLFFYWLWLLILWLFFWLAWTDYYLDVWVITNKRIIDVEQKGIFNREISTFYYDRVQDITIEVRGLLATMMDFGDIHVQTAGQGREFILYKATSPHLAKREILNQVIKTQTI